MAILLPFLGPRVSQMCRQLPLVGMHTHTHPQGSPWCDKPNKKLEKNLDPPIINPIIREGKNSLIFPTQMCPKLPLLSMHTHTRPQGSLWCDKPDKKLGKNFDPSHNKPHN